MSYEPSRSKAYDSDIRWRIVYQRLALEYSVQRVSANLGVSQSTVRRIGSCETLFNNNIIIHLCNVNVM